ncbi:hypothetical protein AMEX_G4169 [Astyanax mexicanus]|uniref:Uncharacterized protein n=1 Tax=Astyanax mexicanus TaxID=7994 RepID=A0A8T2MDI2_ASTMX|nr:hypothetical protein AMEX_G4169 [Astyanax mexicanus]
MSSKMSVSGEQDTQEAESEIQREGADSSESSDDSLGHPPNFRKEGSTPKLRIQQKTSDNTRNIYKELERKVISMVKKQLKKFVKILKSPDNPAFSDKKEKNEEDQNGVTEGTLKITLQALKNMDKTNLADTLQTSKRSGSCTYLLCKLLPNLKL